MFDGKVYGVVVYVKKYLLVFFFLNLVIIVLVFIFLYFCVILWLVRLVLYFG